MVWLLLDLGVVLILSTSYQAQGVFAESGRRRALGEPGDETVSDGIVLGYPIPRTRHQGQHVLMDQRSNSDLLMQVIGKGGSYEQTRQEARSLLDKHGSLHALFGAARNGSGCSSSALGPLAAAVELYRRRCLEPLLRGEALTSPSKTLDYLRCRLADARQEIFVGLFMDTRHRVLAAEDLFQGSIDGACVYPRVVAERALQLGAAAVIVAHNHPSGVAEPSLSDQAITRRLKDALALLEIRLLDHFIIGDGEPVSMAGRGML